MSIYKLNYIYGIPYKKMNFEKYNILNGGY